MAKNAKRRIVGWIFRAWVTRKDGTRDWARDHGYKAWRIPVYADQPAIKPVLETGTAPSWEQKRGNT